VYDVAPALRRRREAAARVRVRRLLVADVGSGLAVALVGLLLAPGLAVSALGAILVVVGCAGWIALERRSRRREEMDQSRR
jgi:Flp pilus assembly protein TadB